MVGLVVFCHGGMGAELLKAAELIAGRIEGAEAVSMGPAADVDRARDEVGAAIRKLRSKDGVLVLTDMFGGTPSNLALSFLEEDDVEVVTGVNLPMLVKFANHRKDKDLKGLVNAVRDGGVKSIIVASELLRQKAKK